MVCSTLNCLRVTAVLDQICSSLMSVLPTDEQLSMFLSVTCYIAFGLRHPDVCPVRHSQQVSSCICLRGFLTDQ